MNGATVLDAVERFLARFVVYPSEDARVAHVLWIAHAHRLDAWESTPRIAFLSPEPGSGKTRALEVTELLVPRPVLAVNCSPAYLFRRVADPAGTPTILYDEIDTLFGPKAKENEDIRGMLNAGHRKGAVAGRCVVRGKTIDTEELEAYCAVALAGLNDLPDTLMTRSVVVRMRRRSPDETVEPFRRRECEGKAQLLMEALAAWTSTLSVGAWPTMPEGIADRDADVWEALLAVADAAAGSWPERARVAAVSLVSLAHDQAGSLGVRLLGDVRALFGDREHLFTAEILEALNALDEAPWGDLRGKPLDARSLSRRLAKYGVEPHQVRVGAATAKGYSAADLCDPWRRYLGETRKTDVSLTMSNPLRSSRGKTEQTDETPQATLSLSPSRHAGETSETAKQSSIAPADARRLRLVSALNEEAST